MAGYSRGELSYFQSCTQKIYEKLQEKSNYRIFDIPEYRKIKLFFRFVTKKFRLQILFTGKKTLRDETWRKKGIKWQNRKAL